VRATLAGSPAEVSSSYLAFISGLKPPRMKAHPVEGPDCHARGARPARPAA
jgi:hypothetical protein